MTKSITLFSCLLFVTAIGISQEFNLLNTSPGEKSQFQDFEWEPIAVQDDELNWREKSIGLFFMPIPLGIDGLEITDSTGDVIDDRTGDSFSFGFGASFNYDFKKSGDGLGLIAYVAYVLGNNEVDAVGNKLESAIDIFTALKYDIKLGALSKFELSPLVGIGNLSLTGTDVDGPISGSSLYFSGGVRITYLVMNNLFVGADIQTVPIVFDAKKLFEMPDEISVGENETRIVESVKIVYSLPVQVNLSVRYNIF
jgi:hypothetical protein